MFVSSTGSRVDPSFEGSQHRSPRDLRAPSKEAEWSQCAEAAATRTGAKLPRLGYERATTTRMNC
eukprot:765948-Hanusia_phi.AAC.3